MERAACRLMQSFGMKCSWELQLEVDKSCIEKKKTETSPFTKQET